MSVNFVFKCSQQERNHPQTFTFLLGLKFKFVLRKLYLVQLNISLDDLNSKPIMSGIKIRDIILSVIISDCEFFTRVASHVLLHLSK